MKHYLLILMSLCLMGSGTEEKDIKCLQLRRVIPMVDSKGFIVGEDAKQVRIFYKGTKRLYMSPYFYDSIVNNKVLKSETRYRYFLFDKDSLSGTYFEPDEQIVKRHGTRDSFMYIKRFSDFGIYESIVSGSFKLTSTSVDNVLKRRHETYVGREQTDDGVVSGKVYLSYSDKMRDVELTISRELDSLKKSKLYQVKILTDPKPKSSKVPYTTLITMEWIADFDRRMIEDYFRQF